MRPKSTCEDAHDHIVDIPSYAMMIKFIGHYETHVDMFFHYGLVIAQFVVRIEDRCKGANWRN
jgi:hypothetical protein